MTFTGLGVCNSVNIVGPVDEDDTRVELQVDSAVVAPSPVVVPGPVAAAVTAEPQVSDCIQGTFKSFNPPTLGNAAVVASLPPIPRIEAHIGQLNRKLGSLGILIKSAPSKSAGVPLAEVVSGGQADTAGFNTSMSILTINGVDVRGFTQAEAGSQIVAADLLVLQVDSAVVAPSPALPPILRIEAHVGQLNRKLGSLGIVIKSAPGKSAGVPLTEVVSGGQADAAGFKVRMSILTINGVDVRGFTQAKAGAQLVAADVIELQVDAKVTPPIDGYVGVLNRQNGPLGLVVKSAPRCVTTHLAWCPCLSSSKHHALCMYYLIKLYDVVKSAPRSANHTLYKSEWRNIWIRDVFCY